MSYLWTGSVNGIKLQIWSTCGATPRYPKGLPSGRAERYPLGRRKTQGREGDFKSKRCPQGSQNRQTEKSPPGAHRWLFYAVLMDLGDAVADELALPVDRISLEMIYRGLYHFSVARQKGLTDDPIKYLAAEENRDLGIVKSVRKPPVRLIVAPFPALQKNSPDFFFSPNSPTLLSTAIQA